MALSLCTDLSATQRRVLAALIEHFNRKTSRCDPSIDRLAALLGIHRRTVFRALNSLVARGYVVRMRHGGFNHRNRYLPNWILYESIVKKWKDLFLASSRARVTELSPTGGQRRHLAGGRTGTQTSSINSSNLTLAPASDKTSTETKSEGASNFPGSSHRPIKPTFRTPSSYDAARAAAERRWCLELQRALAADEHLTAVAADLMTPELMRSATEAEFAKRGAGLALVLSHLGPLRKGGGSPR